MEPIAVVADPHYHDVDYRPGGGRGPGVAFRTLADTAKSTRVFNESFAAFPALLDDIVARGIRIVVLLGDLTDDGQASTMRAAVALLDRYRARHGLRFFATPGNHDLYAIHGRHQGKRFLNRDGSHTFVTSDPAAAQGAVGRAHRRSGHVLRRLFLRADGDGRASASSAGRTICTGNARSEATTRSTRVPSRSAPPTAARSDA